jgi:hypothetical protein
MVEKTIDLEKLDSHVYVIKPEYDKNLEALAGKLFQASIPRGLLLHPTDITPVARSNGCGARKSRPGTGLGA